jgi:hypothetical protein
MAVAAEVGPADADSGRRFREPEADRCVSMPQEDSFFPGYERPGGPYADVRRSEPDSWAELSTAYAHRGSEAAAGAPRQERWTAAR